MAIKSTKGRIVFNIANAILLSSLMIVTIYPFLYVLAASLSDSHFIQRGMVTVIPIGTNLSAYRAVFAYPLIGRAYLNTVLYTSVGTVINLTLTMFGAYPLSRQRLVGKNLFTFFIVFTMLFSGGMIPTFLVVRGVGLYNTFWAMVIPNAISAWNLVIMRTFFQQIPDELEESAIVDGANELKVLFKIIIPLSIPAIMTIGLFYAVSHWNSFFPALIYLRDKDRFPIQILLRQVVILHDTDEMMEGLREGEQVVAESVKFATIMAATLPILTVYPFIQKYFVKGVMIGAVKG